MHFRFASQRHCLECLRHCSSSCLPWQTPTHFFLFDLHRQLSTWLHITWLFMMRHSSPTTLAAFNTSSLYSDCTDENSDSAEITWLARLSSVSLLFLSSGRVFASTSSSDVGYSAVQTSQNRSRMSEATPPLPPLPPLPHCVAVGKSRHKV